MYIQIKANLDFYRDRNPYNESDSRNKFPGLHKFQQHYRKSIGGMLCLDRHMGHLVTNLDVLDILGKDLNIPQ